MNKMRYLLTLLLIWCLMDWTICRPSQAARGDDREMAEAEYEGDDETATDDTLRDEEEVPVNRQESRVNDREEDDSQTRLLNRNGYYNENGGPLTSDDRVTRTNEEAFSVFKNGRRNEAREDDSSNTDEQIQPLLKRRQPARYIDNYETNEPQFVQNTDNRESNYEANRMQNRLRADQISKRRGDPRGSDEGELLFDNHNKREQLRIEKGEHNDEPADASVQSHYYKHNHNPARYENREIDDDKIYGNEQGDQIRDRRDAQESEQADINKLSVGGSGNRETNNEAANDDEQAAIKRHIKKLSSGELEELLNSLSEDKRLLLQKIIDSDLNFELNSLTKREITKKAGAVEENSFMEGSQSDSNKIQGGPAINLGTDVSATPNSESTETTKANDSSQEGTDQSSTKAGSENNVNSGSENKELNNNAEAEHDKIDNNAISVASTAELVTLKCENKREINMNDYISMNNDVPFEEEKNSNESQDPSSDQLYVISQDDDMAQLMDDEQKLHLDNRNLLKRDISQEVDSELSDSIKSLEDSFPNAYEDSGSYSASDMATLIRVKRRNKNHAVKKRAAAIFPEPKVAFRAEPYRAENDDEDNDEGSEFDDDGFFDHTANFAKSNIDTINESRASKMSNKNSDVTLNNIEQSELVHENNDSNAKSIGLDTDNVLFGVKGVDDNLTISSVRYKRKAANAPNLPLPDDLTNLAANPQHLPIRSDDDNKTPVTTNSLNAQNYDGNDAFGPLPKGYEGELGRYKRIRRVKQSKETPAVYTSTE